MVLIGKTNKLFPEFVRALGEPEDACDDEDDDDLNDGTEMHLTPQVAAN